VLATGETMISTFTQTFALNIVFPYSFHVFCTAQHENNIAEGSLEAKLPTIWTNGKAEVVRVKEEKRRRKKIKKRKFQKKEDPGARKGRKVTRHCVFQ